MERGTVLAQSEDEAREKLRKYRVEKVKLQKLHGQSGFYSGFTASIK